jgi:hypothetical protein
LLALPVIARRFEVVGGRSIRLLKLTETWKLSGPGAQLVEWLE